MLKTLQILSLSIAFPAAAVAASSAPPPFACPAEFSSVDQNARQVPPGWQAALHGTGPRHLLQGFMINLGPVSQSSGAIYDDVQETEDATGAITSRLIWNVQPLEDAYAVCAYSRTSLVLTRSLKGYRECVATSRRSKGTQFQMESAVCR